MKISEPVLAILAECHAEGNAVFLPSEQLDRKTYEDVNKCLEYIGGKWNRKAKGHVFDSDPSEALDNLIYSGETEDVKKKFQFFPTPRPIAETVCEMAEISERSIILEPSAGNGALVKAAIDAGATKIYAVEINPAMVAELKKLNEGEAIVAVDCGDFLKVGLAEKIRADRVIMNPPFSKQQDIDHVMEAWKVLRPGGILVSVISPSPFFRTNKKSVDFQSWLHEVNAEVNDIPEGAFKESGTMVRTKIIKVRKPV